MIQTDMIQTAPKQRRPNCEKMTRDVACTNAKTTPVKKQRGRPRLEAPEEAVADVCFQGEFDTFWVNDPSNLF